MTKISVSNKDLTKLPKKFVRLVVTEDKPSWHRLVETKDSTLEYQMGVGKYKEMTPRKFITFVRSVVRAAKAHQVEHLAIQLLHSHFPQLDKERGEAWIVSTMVENILLADYEFTKYQTKKSDKKKLKEVLICGEMNKTAKAAFERGLIVGTATNTSRDIANTTAEHMTPTELGKAAVKALKGTKAAVKVLSEKEIKRLKMGLLYAVGKGSENETKLIIIEYYGAGKPRGKKVPKDQQPIVLVGKGITYDTGGLNVKPSGFMHDMHLDMSGGSSVIGAMTAIAKLKLKKNVIALVPAAENAVSDKAMRAGDIVTAYNGKTVEIIHTDAEGRLVLADALSYAAEKYTPKVMVDVATLTGAALVALGQHASAVMTNDQILEDTLRTRGEESGDYVWPLPLWDEYQPHIKSTRADIANIMPNFSRYGGTIEGGSFIKNFVPEKTPWAHIDIAPRMEAILSDKLAKGSTGEPVRLLVKFVEQY